MSWTSIEVIEKFNVKIPENLNRLCDYMATQLTTEYAILTNIASIEEDVITLKEEFYIPKQTVSTSFITIDSSDTNIKNYDTIIHRHPDGCHWFSTTDKEHINLNFKNSILYTKAQDFVKGIYNLAVSKRKFFQIENKFEIVPNDIQVDEVAVDTAILENVIIDDKFEKTSKYKYDDATYEPFVPNYRDDDKYDLFTGYGDRSFPKEFDIEEARERAQAADLSDLNERIDVIEGRIEEIYDIVVELKEVFSIETKTSIGDNVEDIKISVEKYSDNLETSINEIKDLLGSTFESLNHKIETIKTS